MARSDYARPRDRLNQRFDHPRIFRALIALAERIKNLEEAERVALEQNEIIESRVSDLEAAQLERD